MPRTRKRRKIGRKDLPAVRQSHNEVKRSNCSTLHFTIHQHPHSSPFPSIIILIRHHPNSSPPLFITILIHNHPHSSPFSFITILIHHHPNSSSSSFFVLIINCQTYIHCSPHSFPYYFYWSSYCWWWDLTKLDNHFGKCWWSFFMIDLVLIEIDS